MVEEKKLKEDITKSKVHTRPEPSTGSPERKESVQEGIKELEKFLYSSSIVNRQTELIIHLNLIRDKINEIIRSF